MKPVLYLFAGVLLSTQIFAQANGPFEGHAFSTAPIPGYSQSWTNQLNVGNSDDVYATFGNLPNVVGAYSSYIMVQDFGFNVPPSAIVKGIKVEVERSDPEGKTSDYSIRIIREGVLGIQEKSTGASYPVSDGYITYGSETDLWGETWSYKSIGNNDFGIAISAQRNTSGGITGGRIDNIKVTVYYTFTVLPVTLSSFTASKSGNQVSLKWVTAAEQNMDEYQVERSADGRYFSAIGTVAATNQSSSVYNFTDKNPLPGTSYYRLAMIGKVGDRSLSQVLPVQFRNQNNITLSPSPWTKGNDLSISNPAKERLTIQFYKADGKILGKTITVNHEVAVPFLAETKGVVYFKVLDENNKLKGMGSMLVY